MMVLLSDGIGSVVALSWAKARNLQVSQAIHFGVRSKVVEDISRYFNVFLSYESMLPVDDLHKKMLSRVGEMDDVLLGGWYQNSSCDELLLKAYEAFFKGTVYRPLIGLSYSGVVAVGKALGAPLYLVERMKDAFESCTRRQ